MPLRLPRLLITLLLVGSISAAALPPPELKWETAGFMAPESVVYDAHRDCFYVSNMASYGETRVPDDGFISKVSRHGDIIELKWAVGMDDPKGLAVANGRLYVGDTPAMFEVDLESGEVLARHAPEDGDSGSFNDCTADPSGNVYVYSSRLKTVFRLHAGKFEAWKEIDPSVTGGLNGLRAETNRLLLGGWSFHNDAGAEEPGHLSQIRFADKSLSRIGDQPIAHIDGIEPDGAGGYTVTDWLTGDVKHVSAAGASELIMTLGQGTADHEYLIEDHLMLVPLMLKDKIHAYTWTPPTR